MVEVKRNDIIVLGFIDTYKSGCLDGLPIINIHNYVNDTESIIIICSYQAQEIAQYLERLAIHNKIIFCDVTQHYIKGSLDITTKCNGKCIFCGNIQRKNRVRGPDWTLQEFRQAYDHIKAVAEVCFSSAAGEPLFNRNIAEMLEICKKAGKKTSFYTNGSPLTASDNLEKILSFTDKIYISFVSPHEDIHKKYMRQINPTRVDKNISELISYKNRPLLFMNVLVMRDNINHLKDILIYADNRSIDNITFTLMRGGDQVNLKSLVLGQATPAERASWQQGIRELEELNKSLRINVSISPNLRKVIYFQDEFSEMRANNYRGDNFREMTRVCHLPWSSFNIYYEGIATPCCNRGHNLGNIFNTSRSLFECQQHKDLRKALWEGKLPGVCKTCEVAPLGEVAELRKTLQLMGFHGHNN